MSDEKYGHVKNKLSGIFRKPLNSESPPEYSGKKWDISTESAPTAAPAAAPADAPAAPADAAESENNIPMNGKISNMIINYNGSNGPKKIEIAEVKYRLDGNGLTINPIQINVNEGVPSQNRNIDTLPTNDTNNNPTVNGNPQNKVDDNNESRPPDVIQLIKTNKYAKNLDYIITIVIKTLEYKMKNNKNRKRRFSITSLSLRETKKNYKYKNLKDTIRDYEKELKQSFDNLLQEIINQKNENLPGTKDKRYDKITDKFDLFAKKFNEIFDRDKMENLIITYKDLYDYYNSKLKISNIKFFSRNVRDELIHNFVKLFDEMELNIDNIRGKDVDVGANPNPNQVGGEGEEDEPQPEEEDEPQPEEEDEPQPEEEDEPQPEEEDEPQPEEEDEPQPEEEDEPQPEEEDEPQPEEEDEPQPEEEDEPPSEEEEVDGQLNDELSKGPPKGRDYISSIIKDEKEVGGQSGGVKITKKNITKKYNKKTKNYKNFTKNFRKRNKNITKKKYYKK